MAMTKKEAAAFEALQNEVRLAKALRWTECVAEDVAPPSVSEQGDRLSKGWVYSGHGERGERVERACSTAMYHGRGQDDKTTSQRPIWMYSTRKLAFQAMRNEVEREAAEKLARIDAQIERCTD